MLKSLLLAVKNCDIPLWYTETKVTNLIKLTEGLKKQVERGISILKSGGLVAFPTDTVYGLGALSTIDEAIERVYRVKERPRDMALPLLLADIAQISEVARYIPPVALLLARKFLPGGLTLVLFKAESVSDMVTARGETVAVRVPDHPVAIALIKGAGAPIIGTSANLSGRPAPLTAEEVRARLGDRIDLIIYGGWCPGGRESTVVDVTSEKPRILREGAISRERLSQVCEII